MKPKETSAPRLLAKFDISHRNILIYAAGLAVLVLGYILLSIGPWDNPLGRTAAPIVLLIGYLVIIPWAILAAGKREPDNRQKPE